MENLFQKELNQKKSSNLIFLIGPMGSGKSAVGKALSIALNYQYEDTDKLIEWQTDSTIELLFKRYGEIHFRDIEYQILFSLLLKKNLIVSTGGGMPIFNGNMDLINLYGTSFYLKVDPEVQIERIKTSRDQRPLLHQNRWEGKLIALNKKRNAIYNQADYIIENNVEIQTCVEGIKDILFNPKNKSQHLS